MLLLLNTSPVQNYIAQKITASISKKIGAQVSIRKVSISPFNKLNIEGVLIRDQNKDTLLFANLCKIRITDWFFKSLWTWDRKSSRYQITYFNSMCGS